MFDVFLAVVLLALLVAIVVVSRSLTTSALLVSLGIGVSGVALQFASSAGLSVTLATSQWWLLATLLAIVAAAIVLRRRSPQPYVKSAFYLLLGTSVAVALLAVATRFLAPGAPGPLTGVGYLITRTGAEDNAKWLNAAAELAGGTPVDSWANVGGPLLLLLTLSATLISAFSQLLYGGINEVAVSAGSLILSEWLLVVLSPLAVAPLVEARLRTVDGWRRIPWPYLLLSVAIAVSGVTVLLNLGHLTLQYTILTFTLWVGVFMVSRTVQHARLLATFAVITTAEVWFPINVLTVGLMLAVVVWAIRGIIRNNDRPARYASLAGIVVLLVLMWGFLSSSILYALGIGTSSGTAMGTGGSAHGVVASIIPALLPLFASPGGTEIVSAIVGAMTVVAVLGAYLMLRRPQQAGWSSLVPFAPVAAMTLYAILITFADFWAVGDGPGYATNKLTYAITIPILVCAAPIALLHFDRAEKVMTPLRWLALGGVVALLVLDSLLPRAIIQFKPSIWPSTAGDPQPYWWPGEVRPTADQPLTSNPIGCIYLPPGAEKPSVLFNGQRAYSCTRLLTGVAGQDVPAASVVQWTLDEWLQNESMWDKYHRYFELLTPETRARTLILLDNDSKVVGVESIQSLLDRYPAQPLAATS